jgi:hypothetical protein
MGERSTLTPLNFRYEDFAYRDQQRQPVAAMLEELNYRSKQLSGAPELTDMPPDFKRPASVEDQRDAARSYCSLSADVGFEIESLAKRRRATSFVLLLAAMQYLVYRYIGQGDQVIGVLLSTRPQDAFEGVTSTFEKLLPLREEIEADRTAGGIDIELDAWPSTARMRQTGAAPRADHPDAPRQPVLDFPADGRASHQQRLQPAHRGPARQRHDLRR